MTTLDVTGGALRLALAWAYAAHAPAGAYWPAAFGAAAARTPTFRPARDWLRVVARKADGLIGDLRLLELEAGPSRARGPRYADMWTTEDDGQLHLSWDTSVSLILSSIGDEPDWNEPARLRLALYGEHEGRERLAREALELDEDVAADLAIKAWSSVVEGPAKALEQRMTDEERAFMAAVSTDRLETLALYRRLVDPI